MVKVAGRPTPTVTWLFDGRKVEDDYSTELGKDGSLVLVSAELKHAGTYTFTVSNRVGSVERCTKLVVHTEDEECTSVPRVESNPIAKEKFGEYVSTFHAHNNSGFTGQFQVICHIDTAPPCMIWYSSKLCLFLNFRFCPLERKVTRQLSAKLQQTDFLNRFNNITACKPSFTC